MRGQVQEFNKFGPITHDHSDPLNIPSVEVGELTDEELLELADQKHDAQEASDDPVDEDGDGHDDDTGQFVDGNTEAADGDAEEVVAEDAAE